MFSSVFLVSCSPREIQRRVAGNVSLASRGLSGQLYTKLVQRQHIRNSEKIFLTFSKCCDRNIFKYFFYWDNISCGCLLAFFNLSRRVFLVCLFIPDLFLKILSFCRVVISFFLVYFQVDGEWITCFGHCCFLNKEHVLSLCAAPGRILRHWAVFHWGDLGQLEAVTGQSPQSNKPSTLMMEVATWVELLHGVTPQVSLILRSEKIGVFFFCKFLCFRQEKVTGVLNAEESGFEPRSKNNLFSRPRNGGLANALRIKICVWYSGSELYFGRRNFPLNPSLSTSPDISDRKKRKGAEWGWEGHLEDLRVK
jgi:hypothetical protein